MVGEGQGAAHPSIIGWLEHCQIRISANYTSASKSYLTHLSCGKDKNREFSRLIYTSCIGHHSMPSFGLTSLNLMTSLNVTVVSSQYGVHLHKRVDSCDPLGFSPLWFEPGSGHMWESQVLLTDGQVVFLRVLRFSPTFDERSARYK